jgi:hypothetical protein
MAPDPAPHDPNKARFLMLLGGGDWRTGKRK